MNQTAEVAETLTLTINRKINAPVEKVFEAWTDAAMLAKWFGPEGVRVTSAKSDARVGGTYEIVMQPPEGNPITHFGEYTEIIPNEKLCYTWVLCDQDCAGSKGLDIDTMVTVTFKPEGDTTLLAILHEGLPNQKARDGHAFGWNGCLDSLERMF